MLPTVSSTTGATMSEIALTAVTVTR